MFKQSIFSSDSSQNNIKEKKSDKRTKRGLQKSNEREPLEAKWKQAEDPKEPRPARRSRQLRVRVDPNLKQRNKKYFEQ